MKTILIALVALLAISNTAWADNGSNKKFSSATAGMTFTEVQKSLPALLPKLATPEERLTVGRCNVGRDPVNENRQMANDEEVVINPKDQVITYTSGSGKEVTCILSMGAPVVVSKITGKAKWVFACGNDILSEWFPKRFPTQGERGLTGLAGPRGPQGSAGPQGQQGQRGLKGDKGDAGRDGTDGKPGLCSSKKCKVLSIVGIVGGVALGGTAIVIASRNGDSSFGRESRFSK